MIHTDHLATPHKMTDSNGTVVWSAYYKPFGAATITVSTITNNLRFPGQYLDAETGLNYNYKRDYNPMIGRYVEADPIGLNGGPNLYLYGWDNALNRSDPSGLKCNKSYKADWESAKETPVVTTQNQEWCVAPPDAYDKLSTLLDHYSPPGEKPKNKYPKIPVCLAKELTKKWTYEKFLLISYVRIMCYNDCTGALVSDTGWQNDGIWDTEMVLIDYKEQVHFALKWNP